MKKTKKNPPRPTLSPACALIGRFGSRWALLVLLTLHEGGVLRFGELVRAVPGGISERMLSAALRDLERAGLVARRVYPEVPPRVEYSLTELGESMRPILNAMSDWGSNYKRSFDTK